MSGPEEHWQGIPDRYDIMYTSPLSRVPPQIAAEDRPLVAAAMQQHTNPNGPDGLDLYSGTLIYLARSLAEARRFLRAFRDERMPASLVPIRYREARVSRSDARQVAQALFERWQAAHAGTYGPLSEGADRRLYWQFHAANLAYVAEGSGAWLSVDRWDGHEVTSDELWAWLRFSRGSRTTTKHWQGIADLYDVHVTASRMKDVPALPEEDRRLIEEALHQAQRKRELAQTRGVGGAVIHLARPIDEVRDILSALRAVGVYGAALPVRYREPRVDRDAAQRAAQVYLDELQASEAELYGRLTAGSDWLLWWRFRTERVAEQPWQREFYVDKWDGHVSPDDWEVDDLHQFSRAKLAP